jgi:hypothetical protein
MVGTVFGDEAHDTRNPTASTIDIHPIALRYLVFTFMESSSIKNNLRIAGAARAVSRLIEPSSLAEPCR